MLAKPTPWTLQAAVELAQKIELIAPDFDMHVALTGGCLYKLGERKDADFLFYCKRGTHTDKEALEKRVCGLLEALGTHLGFIMTGRYGWVQKAETADGWPLDLFFPEDQEGSEYQP